jgi:hypothetical protein
LCAAPMLHSIRQGLWDNGEKNNERT